LSCLLGLFCQVDITLAIKCYL